jgi:putative lipoprotein
MRKLALLPLTAALTLAACGGDSPAPAPNTGTGSSARVVAPAPPAPVTGPKVTGRIEVTGLTELPAGLQMVVRVVDVTDPTIVPPVFSEVLMPAPRVLPYDFEIGYDAARLDATRRYVVEASLQTDGVVLYGTPAATPVLTQGGVSDGVVLTLVRGGKAVATVAPSEQIKLDFAALETNLGTLRRISGERLDEAVAVGWDAFVDSSGQVRMAREQVETAEGGTAAYRYAYQGGQPTVVERKQGGSTTLLGWTSDGQLILNEKSGATASDEEVAALQKRAADVYAQAAARR